MTSICSTSSWLVRQWRTHLWGKDLPLIQADAASGNSPLWFGEWSLDTQFNATDEFLYQWADAQKFAYNKGAGWIVRVP